MQVWIGSLSRSPQVSTTKGGSEDSSQKCHYQQQEVTLPLCTAHRAVLQRKHASWHFCAAYCGEEPQTTVAVPGKQLLLHKHCRSLVLGNCVSAGRQGTPCQSCAASVLLGWMLCPLIRLLLLADGIPLQLISKYSTVVGRVALPCCSCIPCSSGI